MHYPRLSDIGMSIQDLLDSAKRLKVVYESKTYAISTTPRIMENLDKKIQGHPTKSSSSKWTAEGYRAKLDSQNELDACKQELMTLKQNNAAINRRLSRLKIRDGRIVLAITVAIETLESLNEGLDQNAIMVINSQCDSLRSLAESLKHSALEFHESSPTLEENPEFVSQNFNDDVKKFMQSGLDNRSANVIEKATSALEGLNKVIFGASETTIKQASIIKMHPKIQRDNSSHASSSDAVMIDQDPLAAKFC
jgi:hypothetical protein